MDKFVTSLSCKNTQQNCVHILWRTLNVTQEADRRITGGRINIRTPSYQYRDCTEFYKTLLIGRDNQCICIIYMYMFYVQRRDRSGMTSLNKNTIIYVAWDSLVLYIIYVKREQDHL